MKLGAHNPFRNKIPSAWKRPLQSLKLRLEKPFFIRGLQFRGSKYELRRTARRRRYSKAISVLRCFKSSREMDRVMELKSFSDPGYSLKDPSPSPLTPAYVKLSAANINKMEASSGRQDLDDACRSFENCLVEMIFEEGRIRDLADIEELLFCLKRLKCPVFVDLICRFYAELCNDLFSNDNEAAA